MPWVGNSLYKSPIKRKPKKSVVNGVVKKVMVISGGLGYTIKNNVGTCGGTGPQFGQFNCRVDISKTYKTTVTEVIITKGGIGYTVNDILTIKSGSGECKIRVMDVS
jgi:carbamate kinase